MHGDAGSVLKAIGQWLKVVADSKAQLAEACMRLRPTRRSDACVEFGAFVGYTALPCLRCVLVKGSDVLPG